MQKLVHNTSQCLEAKHVSFYVLACIMCMLFFFTVLEFIPDGDDTGMVTGMAYLALSLTAVMTAMTMVLTWLLMTGLYSINNGRGLFWLFFLIAAIHAALHWMYGIGTGLGFFSVYLRWGLLVLTSYAVFGEMFARGRADKYFWFRLLALALAIILHMNSRLWSDIAASLLYGIITLFVLAQAPFRLTKDLDQRLEVVKFQVSSES